MVSPQTPYGYRYVPKDETQAGPWEIHPQEALVVRQIYDWYTQDPAVSSFEIAARLEAQKEQLPPRHAKHWYSSAGGCILKQKQCTGQAYYNRTGNAHEQIGQPKAAGHGRRRSVGRSPRPTSAWIAMPVPAILSKEVWQGAQERLAMNPKFSLRNHRRHSYLLRGLLVCATCGYTLVGRTRSNGQVSYACVSGGSVHRTVDIPAHTCSIHAEEIEPLVWQALTDLLRNPQLIAQVWQLPSDPSAPQSGEAEWLRQRRNTLDRQQERLLDLFQEEQIEKAVYLQPKQRLDQERTSIDQRTQPLCKQVNAEQARQQLIANFAQYCQQIEANLTHPTPKIQQEVIRLLIDHIIVAENEIVIKHIVPTAEDGRLHPRGKRTDF